MPTLRRSAGIAVMASPSTSTLPVVGNTNPAMIRSSVVLPHPLGPSSAISSPGWMAKLMSASARTSP